MTKTLPFGLLFEEEVQSQEYPIQPEYDYEKKLSFVKQGDKCIPFVEWEWNTFAVTKTGTTTKAQGDEEDVDEDDIRYPRTHTITETRENTDRD